MHSSRSTVASEETLSGQVAPENLPTYLVDQAFFASDRLSRLRVSADGNLSGMQEHRTGYDRGGCFDQRTQCCTIIVARKLSCLFPQLILRAMSTIAAEAKMVSANLENPWSRAWRCTSTCMLVPGALLPFLSIAPNASVNWRA